MSFLDNIKSGKSKLTGAVKIKLPKHIAKKSKNKWDILDKQAPLQNLMKRVQEYIQADMLGKKQRNAAFNSMSFILKSNKYNDSQQLILLGAFKQHKDLPFVKRLLDKFPASQIESGISLMQMLKKTGEISAAKVPALKKPSPKFVDKTPSPPALKKPSPKFVDKTPSPPALKKPSPNLSPNEEYYTPLGKIPDAKNTKTALGSIKQLLHTQKPNDVLKISLLIVGKKLKRFHYARS